MSSSALSAKPLFREVCKFTKAKVWGLYGSKSHFNIIHKVSAAGLIMTTAGNMLSSLDKDELGYRRAKLVKLLAFRDKTVQLWKQGKEQCCGVHSFL